MTYPGDDVARRALDVLGRRPWGVECIFWGDVRRQFQAVDESDKPIGDTQAYDPFTAICVANDWMTEQESKRD